MAFKPWAASPRPSNRCMTGSSTTTFTTTPRHATRSARTRRRSRAGTAYQTYGAWSFCEARIPPTRTTWRTSTKPRCSGPRTPATSRRRGSRTSRGRPRRRTEPRRPWWSAYAPLRNDGRAGQAGPLPHGSAVPDFDPTQWHVYTQTWGPGLRSYYVDGQLVGTSRDQGVAGMQSLWQLQVEPSVAGGSGTGHVYVKWVWIGTAP